MVFHPRDGPNDGAFVQFLGNAGQMLAYADSGQLGRDGFELSPDLRGGVLLHVEGIHLRRPTLKVDHDDRLLGTSGP